MAEQPNIQEVIDFAKAKGFEISPASGDDLFTVRPLPVKTPGQVAADLIEINVDTPVRHRSIWVNDLRGRIANKMDALYREGYTSAISDGLEALTAAGYGGTRSYRCIARLVESKAAAKVEAP